MEQPSTAKPLSPGWRFFVSRIVPLIFIVVGIFLLCIGCKELYDAARSMAWPSTEGVIQFSYLNRRPGSRPSYNAKVSYAYSVGGSSYLGDRVTAYGGDISHRSMVHPQKIIDKYPEKKRVTVYYLPESPKVSVLEPGLGFGASYKPFAGLACFAIGIFIGIVLPKQMRRSAANEALE